MSQDVLTQIRDLLLKPGDRHWWELLFLLRTLDGSVEQEVAVQYAQAHLSDWPTHLREFPQRSPQALLGLSDDAFEWRLCRALDLGHCKYWKEKLYPIFDDPRLLEVEHLRLVDCELEQIDVHLFVEGPLASGLRSFHTDGWELNADCIRMMVDSGLFGGLEELTLNGFPYDGFSPSNPEDGVIEIFGTLSFPHLKKLQISTCDLRHRLYSWAGCDWLSGLEALSLPLTAIDADEFERLFSFTRFSRLKKLDLAQVGIDDEHMAGFLEHGLFPALEELDLSGHELSTFRLFDFGETLHLPSLRKLHFGENEEFGESCLKALMKSPFLPELRELGIGGLRSNSHAMEDFLELSVLPLVESFDLSYNPISAKAMRTLAQEGRFPKLKKLFLSGCGLDVSMLRSFLRAPVCRQLMSLDLSGNFEGSFRDEELPARFMGMAEGLSGLEVLGFGNNGCGDRSMVALVESPHLGKLKSLYYDTHVVSMASLRVFVESGFREQLELLSLADVELSLESCRVLCGVGVFGRLQHLDLQGASLEDGVVGLLAESEVFPRLRSLNLEGCRIGARELEQLEEGRGMPSLQSVKIGVGEQRFVSSRSYRFLVHWEDERFEEVFWSEDGVFDVEVEFPLDIE